MEVISLEPEATRPQSPVAEFLERRRQELTRFNGEEQGQVAYDALCVELERHFGRLGAVMETHHQFCELVIGRVQSGKTGHLSATIAWAAEQGFTAVAIVTGINDELKDQTFRRLRKDLERLPSAPIQLIDVPTYQGGTGRRYIATEAQVRHAARLRVGAESLGHPMPVLVVLKKPQRVESMAALLADLAATDDDSMILIIDDEADQASPNARVRNAELSATYEQLGSAREMVGRHILLSYTATPQAILASPPTSALRPDRCHVTMPGRGYFGLADLMGPEFGGRTAITDAVQLQPGQRPRSLDEALAGFFMAAAVRRNAPDFFYASRPSGVDISRRMESVQFLLHPSGRQIDHDVAYQFVTHFQAEVIEQFQHDRELLFSELLRPAYARLRDSLPAALAIQLPPVASETLMADVVRSIASGMQIRVVNSDPAAATLNTLPESDDAWEASQAWVLIGGNILGRGVTIPQLVTTYFLRSPRTPQFDTTNQQLRFCGYRQDYRHMITVWAPDPVWDRLAEINDIDRIALRRAEHWDRQQVSLREEVPSIIYVAASDARVSPTRRSVIDPAITDHAIGRRMFQTRYIASPRRFLSNYPALRDLVSDDSGLWSSVEGEWDVLVDPDPGAIESCLANLTCTPAEKHLLNQILDLTDPSTDELGFHGRPWALFASERTRFMLEPIDWSRNMPNSLRATNAEAVINSRHLRLSDLPDWEAAVKECASEPFAPDNLLDQVRMDQFFGDEHERLQASLQHDAIAMFVQPLALTEKPHSATRVAMGIAVGLVAPRNFRVRVIGHQT